MYTFLLPDAGEGTHESEIVRWHFQEGDRVEEFDVLFEMESDKATVDIPSPVSGVIKKIYVAEGEIGIVGKPVVDIATGSEDGAPAGQPSSAGEEAGAGGSASRSAASASQSAPTQPKPSSNGGADNTAGVNYPDDDQARTQEQAQTPQRGPEVDVRTLAVPRVRVFARRNQVDLTQVHGSGNHGKITMEDVEAFLAGDTESIKPAPEEPAVSAAGAPNETPVTQSCHQPRRAKCESQATSSPASGQRRERREPLSAMRKATNRALVTSYTQAPHVTIMDRVDCSQLVTHRGALKEKAASREVKLTYTAYLVKAAAAMLKAHPRLNAQIDAGAEEMVFFDDINVGVAVDTPSGLVVPVIRDVDHLSLFGVARAITADAERAREGKLSGHDMKGGSLTITNVGGFATGGVWSTPIINSGEAVIIGIGRIEEEFMPDENRQPVLKPMMKISFTFDHRVVDGVAAQLALNDFKDFIADPNLLLAEG